MATEMLNRLLLVRHYGEVAHRAVRQQYQRLKVPPPRLDDGYLYAVALADLLRAAEEAQRLTGCAEIGEQVDLISGARDFRNVLEHWPDYARGKGRDAERLGLVPGDHWFWWESELKLRIGGSRAGVVLDIERAEEVVRRLYVVLHDALEAAINKAMGG
jgi:hypothetical protein